jgi:hypothetical protein
VLQDPIPLIASAVMGLAALGLFLATLRIGRRSGK